MDAPNASPGAARELVSVRVSGQMFALDILDVREIRGWTASTPLPHAPAYVVGMINLRGAALPVMDLAARLGLESRDPDAASVVVVAELNGRPVGLLVEAVCDITLVTDDLVQSPPDLGDSELSRFVDGLVSTEDGIMLLIAPEHLLPLGAAEAVAA